MLYTVIDVESAGLNKYKDSVLSFSYALIDETARILKAETLYFWKEGVTNWTEEAYEVHGLSREFLRQYESDFEKNLKKMYIVLNRAVIMGYNSGFISSKGYLAGFDVIICQSFLNNMGIINDNLSLKDLCDIMQLTRKTVSHPIKLSEAIHEFGLDENLIKLMVKAYFGQDDSSFHSSAFDVMATVTLYRTLAERGVIYVEGVSPKVTYSGPRYRFLKDFSVYDTVDNVTYTAEEFHNLNSEQMDKMLNNPMAYMMEE